MHLSHDSIFKLWGTFPNGFLGVLDYTLLGRGKHVTNKHVFCESQQQLVVSIITQHFNSRLTNSIIRLTTALQAMMTTQASNCIPNKYSPPPWNKPDLPLVVFSIGSYLANRPTDNIP